MKHKPLFSVILVFFLAGLSISAITKPVSLPIFHEPDFSDSPAYPVVRVVDGDTFVVTIDGDNTTIRLQGVDTPETKHPSKPVQAYGKEASRFLTNLLKGEKVYLKPVGEKFHRGKYGRLIAYVYRTPDGLFVNAEIIRQGYGHAYPKYPGKYTEKFCQLERFARNAKKGLWGQEEPKSAPQGRSSGRKDP